MCLAHFVCYYYYCYYKFNYITINQSKAQFTTFRSTNQKRNMNTKAKKYMIYNMYEQNKLSK